MPQYLPEDDAFTEGATEYGSSPCLYSRFRPWTGDSATGYAIDSQVGDIHRGYALPTNTLRAIGDARFPAAAATGSAGEHFVCQLWRAYEGTDSTAQAEFRLHQHLGVSGSDSLRWTGVCVRATGHTLTSAGTDTEHLLRGDSYWFILANDSGVGTDWLLLRVKAGAISVLTSATADLSPGDNTLVTGRELRLHVADSAGDPVLTASTRTHLQAVGAPSWTTVLTHTDTHANKLTAAGRCGFGMTQGRDEGDVETVTLCNFFEARDDGGGLQVRDLFRRSATGHLRDAAQDVLLGTSHPDVAGGWTGDMRSRLIQGYLDRDAGSDRVELDGSETAYGFLLSQRPAGHPASQFRSFSCTFGSGGTANEQKAGVFLRGGIGDSATLLHNDSTEIEGYLFEVVHDRVGGTWTAYLESWEAGSVVTLASKTLAGLATDVAFIPELEVYNQGGTNDLNGVVTLLAKVDAAGVSWDDLGVNGVLVNGTEVTDTRSARHLTGSVEGIYANTDSSSPILLDTWTEGSLTDPPDIPPEDQSSISIAGEADGLTGTLAFQEQYPFPVAYMGAALRFRFDSGHVYRHVRQQSDRRLWTINASALSATDRATLQSFWDSHDGCVVPFNWTPPGGSQVAGCFYEDELSDSMIGPDSFRERFQILELFT